MAGSWWPTSRAGVSSALPSTKTMPRPAPAASVRSSVDFPVPGGPPSTRWRPPSSAAGGSTRPPSSPSVVVDDHAPDVLAVQQVLVALVDLVQRVLLRDELVQLDVPGLVQVQQALDVVDRVAAAEQEAVDRLLEQRQHGAGHR